MTYPFGGACPTQPLIDIQNITLRNISSYGGFLPPGLVRCNETNPCRDINFEDVDIRGWWEGMDLTFISEYAYGNVKNTYPDPKFGKESERVFSITNPQTIFAGFERSMKMYNKDYNEIEGWEVLLGIAEWAIREGIDLLFKKH